MTEVVLKISCGIWKTMKHITKKKIAIYCCIDFLAQPSPNHNTVKC